MRRNEARRGGLAGVLAGVGPGFGGSCAGCLGAGSTAAVGVVTGVFGVVIGVIALVIFGARQVRRGLRACPVERRKRVIAVQVGVLALSALAGFILIQGLLVLYAHSLTRISTH